MQITHIKVELGVTINAGDFQSVKSTVEMRAELDRNEDAEAATVELQQKVRAALIQGVQSAHPDAVRKMLTAEQNVKSVSRKARQQDAEKPTKPQNGDVTLQQPQNGDVTLQQPQNGDVTLQQPQSIDDSIPDSGGGTSTGSIPPVASRLSSTMSDSGLDELDNLLGGSGEEVTKQQVHDAFVDLNKKGGKTAVLEIFKKFGVGNLSQIPETQYAVMKKQAEEYTARIIAAATQ